MVAGAGGLGLFRKQWALRGTLVLILCVIVTNRHRVLAYDNSSLLSRFGRVWVCRGDLRVEYIETEELQRLLNDQK